MTDKTLLRLKNPETGDSHIMDAEAMKELFQCVFTAKTNDRSEVVFRAMRLSLEDAELVLQARDA